MSEAERLAKSLEAGERSGMWYPSMEAAAELRRLSAELEKVRKDAERWKMTVEIGQDVLRHPMSRKVPESVSAYMDAIHKGFDMTHAIDAAIDAAMKGQQ